MSQHTPIPQAGSPTPSRDLTDAEFAELDELLQATPEPLEALDAVMLDGFLCGVLVQPVLLEPAQWLPWVFDPDGQPLPDTADAAWRSRTQQLVLQRHAALNRAMAEDGWFNPLILELDEQADAEAAESGVDTQPAEAANAAFEALPPVSQALMPWVTGFLMANEQFTGLSDMPDDAVHVALARLYRHLPAETDEERELVATLDREQPLASMDDAIEELVVTVADLWDLTQKSRYHVETIKRDTPKLGRNDPCHCGSGRKFKACHGKG